MSIGDLARLLLPVDDTDAAIIEATERWRWEPALAAEVPMVVWGRAPLPSGVSVAVAARQAVARERALVALRRSATAGPRLIEVHRLAPGGSDGRVRALLLGGAMVEVARGVTRRPRRLLDDIADAAGLHPALKTLRLGAGGTALVRARQAEGQPAVLRAGLPPAGHGGASSELVGRLASAGLPVPRPLAAGRLAGVAWSAESALPGRMPARLSRRLLGEVIESVARFPVDAAPRAPTDDLQALQAALPDRAVRLEAMQRWVREATASVPAIARHGDLWSGNLLVSGGHLSGIVDWDAAHEAGVPGADLLQLVVTDDRHRRRLCLGDAWLERPWRRDPWRSAVAAYWRAIDVRPDSELLDLAGVSWWAAEVAGTLRRFPDRASDERWLAANVDAVLAVGAAL